MFTRRSQEAQLTNPALGAPLRPGAAGGFAAAGKRSRREDALRRCRSLLPPPAPSPTSLPGSLPSLRGADACEGAGGGAALRL